MTIQIDRFTQEKIQRLFDGSDRIAKTCCKGQTGQQVRDAVRNLELVVGCYLASEAPWITMDPGVAISARCDETTTTPGMLAAGDYRIKCQVDLRPGGEVYRWTLNNQPGPVQIVTGADAIGEVDLIEVA